MAIFKAAKWALSLIGGFLTRNIRDFFSQFDLRDLFVFGGLAMLGYGLWLFAPWVGWSVAGAILMSFGLLIGKRGR